MTTMIFGESAAGIAVGMANISQTLPTWSAETIGALAGEGHAPGVRFLAGIGHPCLIAAETPAAIEEVAALARAAREGAEAGRRHAAWLGLDARGTPVPRDALVGRTPCGRWSRAEYLCGR